MTTYETELFKIDKSQLLDAASGVRASKCQVSFSSKASTLFSSDWERLYHVARLLELQGITSTIQEDLEHPYLLIVGEPDEPLSAFKAKQQGYEIQIQVDEPQALTELVNDSISVLRSLFYRALKSRITQPLKWDSYDVFDCSTDLTTRMRAEVKRDRWLAPTKVHLGFSYQFRTYDDSHYVQILPKSVIRYDKTLWQLKQEGELCDSLIEKFPFVNIDFVPHSRRIVGITDFKAGDIIERAPYLGRSFVDFAVDMYHDSSVRPDAELVEVLDRETPLFPSTWTRPSLNFTSISYLSDRYYSQLIGILKMQGGKRPDLAKEWVKRLNPFSINATNVEISAVPRAMTCRSGRVEPKNFLSTALNCAFVFKPPSVDYFRSGEKVEIFPGVERYEATVNDLLKHPELRPIDVPRSISIGVFYSEKLADGWTQIKQSLLNGVGDYRGFEKTFGVKISFVESAVPDFLSPDYVNGIREIPEMSYDCALIIVPRYLNTLSETKRVYVEGKTALMERGIPVQVITDDQKITFSRNSTLQGKAQNAFTMFGIAINILAKTGAILTQLSDSSASNLISNSLIMGYDVSRIYPSNIVGVKTIPLTAPLVIFDNKGAYVSHQNVHRLNNEVSLFEQYGEEIFSSLAPSITTLIVHKDGYFAHAELKKLKELADSFKINTIPISVRTSHVPRVFNPNYHGDVGIDAGTVLPLSSDDYLMITTPTGYWDADRFGWPNPILVTFHNLVDHELKLKLLYHIFALTKMQTGSQRPVRTPLSIHFSNMVSRFLRKVGDPTPRYLKYFVQSREGKRLARWFL
jgi:hypothetical protein